MTIASAVTSVLLIGAHICMVWVRIIARSDGIEAKATSFASHARLAA